MQAQAIGVGGAHNAGTEFSMDNTHRQLFRYDPKMAKRRDFN